MHKIPDPNDPNKNIWVLDVWDLVGMLVGLFAAQLLISWF